MPIAGRMVAATERLEAGWYSRAIVALKPCSGHVWTVNGKRVTMTQEPGIVSLCHVLQPCG